MPTDSCRGIRLVPQGFPTLCNSLYHFRCFAELSVSLGNCTSLLFAWMVQDYSHSLGSNFLLELAMVRFKAFLLPTSNNKAQELLTQSTDSVLGTERN